MRLTVYHRKAKEEKKQLGVKFANFNRSSKLKVNRKRFFF